MKDKIISLVEVFRKIEAMPKSDDEERAERERRLESWFKTAKETGIKPETGVTISTDSMTIEGVKHQHFIFVDVFDKISIFIIVQFGRKQKLHEVRFLINLPD
jgi:hypothetical protein